MNEIIIKGRFVCMCGVGWIDAWELLQSSNHFGWSSSYSQSGELVSLVAGKSSESSKSSLVSNVSSAASGDVQSWESLVFPLLHCSIFLHGEICVFVLHWKAASQPVQSLDLRLLQTCQRLIPSCHIPWGLQQTCLPKLGPLPPYIQGRHVVCSQPRIAEVPSTECSELYIVACYQVTRSVGSLLFKRSQNFLMTFCIFCWLLLVECLCLE